MVGVLLFPISNGVCVEYGVWVWMHGFYPCYGDAAIPSRRTFRVCCLLKLGEALLLLPAQAKLSDPALRMHRPAVPSGRGDLVHGYEEWAVCCAPSCILYLVSGESNGVRKNSIRKYGVRKPQPTCV